jgi:hypothetical protein
MSRMKLIKFNEMSFKNIDFKDDDLFFKGSMDFDWSCNQGNYLRMDKKY